MWAIFSIFALFIYDVIFSHQVFFFCSICMYFVCKKTLASRQPKKEQISIRIVASCDASYTKEICPKINDVSLSEIQLKNNETEIFFLRQSESASEIK